MISEWGMHDVFYPAAINWPAYDGQQTVKRMPYSTFVDWSGTLGHMATPGQVHLDPSSLDNLSIDARTKATLGQQGGSQGKYPDMVSLQVGYGVEANRLRALDAKRATLATAHPNWKVLDEIQTHTSAAPQNAKAAHDALLAWNQGEGKQ
jgi:hypothetical protein